MPGTNYEDQNGPVKKEKVEQEILSAREEALKKELEALKKEADGLRKQLEDKQKSLKVRLEKRKALLEKQKGFPKFMLRELRRSDPPAKRTCALCLKRKNIEDFRYSVSEECEECSLLSE